MNTRLPDGSVYGPVCLTNALYARMGLLFALAGVVLEHGDHQLMSCDVAMALEALEEDFETFQESMAESQNRLENEVPRDLRLTFASIARQVLTAEAELSELILPHLEAGAPKPTALTALTLSGMTLQEVAGEEACAADLRDHVQRRAAIDQLERGAAEATGAAQAKQVISTYFPGKPSGSRRKAP